MTLKDSHYRPAAGALCRRIGHSRGADDRCSTCRIAFETGFVHPYRPDVSIHQGLPLGSMEPFMSVKPPDRASRRKLCPLGHEITGEGKGRQCRVCKNEAQRVINGKRRKAA